MCEPDFIAVTENELRAVSEIFIVSINEAVNTVYIRYTDKVEIHKFPDPESARECFNKIKEILLPQDK